MDTSRTLIIGERIRSKRERHHLTLEDVAGRGGRMLTASRPANFEQGIRRPSLEQVEAMSLPRGS
jgi:transcriptional regulator with XRE-family HTH domain